jgi:hypothetical protein
MHLIAPVRAAYLQLTSVDFLIHVTNLPVSVQRVSVPAIEERKQDRDFFSDNGGSKFVRNISTYVSDYTASQPISSQCKSLLL